LQQPIGEGGKLFSRIIVTLNMKVADSTEVHKIPTTRRWKQWFTPKLWELAVLSQKWQQLSSLKRLNHPQDYTATHIITPLPKL
jgi:hypothetical protein